MESSGENISRQGKLGKSGLTIVFGLILLTVAYRLAGSHFGFPGNTAPLMATAFGGALLLGMRFWWVPALALVASDLVLGAWHGEGGIGGYTVVSALFIVGVSFFAGSVGCRTRTWPRMWLGTMVCSVLFYFLANTYSWMAFPGYEKSLAGWWQCQTVGNPNFSPPAWTFLRNALLADTVWCVMAGLLFFFDFRHVAKEDSSVAKPV